MKRLLAWGTTLALVVAAGAVIFVGTASAATCTPTGFFRHHKDLTAAVIGGNVGPATYVTPGCDIGVYLDAAHPGSVTGAKISGETYFGVVVNSTSADVMGSSISVIGDAGFDGAHHGVGIYYTSLARGRISGNTVWQYQKAGIVLNGGGVSAAVTGDTVTGLGPVSFIAQNGIAVYGADATRVTGNTVTDNVDTGTAAGGYVASGILLKDTTSVPAGGSSAVAAANHVVGNEVNVHDVAG